MQHEELADIITRIATNAVRCNRQPRFSVIDAPTTPISDVLYEGFELSDVPQIVENYMKHRSEECICLAITEDQFLPCHNGIVLSTINPQSSFAAFCYKMDSGCTIAQRIRLQEISKRLNRRVEDNSGTAADYIRDLKHIRLTVKDALGETGYKSYLDLILKSGTNRTRFIQELLQNADDCIYPQGRIPSFKLTQRGNTIETEYNEAGFTRANIRSITAIGESTKNRLLNKDLHSIGEKGVGFKSVFAIALEVKIYSGEYNFALKAETPTIPGLLTGVKEPVNGTKMEITLKDRLPTPPLKPANILELCLCLRQLKEIAINEHRVSINDTEAQRTITIDKHPYVFSKYVHTFAVTDRQALEERENGTRVISPNQQIMYYVPDKSSAADYPLYVGLPTTHKLRIPMVIDAPFELTTSREQIETDCEAWNKIVKEEMYKGIVEVIHARKAEDRADVLRFAKVKYQVRGNLRSYANGLSDFDYLNDYNYLTRLRMEKILPTFDRETFVSASSKTAYRYPEVAMLLLKEYSTTECSGLQPETIVDVVQGEKYKERKERIDAVLNAIGCEGAPFEKVFPLLQKYAENAIEDKDFRNCLYEYLQNTPENFREKLLDMKIFPVYGRSGGTQYISWNGNEIFVKGDTDTSDQLYWILNETLLSKATCEKMLGVNINEMNSEWAKNRYRDALQKFIRANDVNTIYKYLVTEFSTGMLRKNDCRWILLEYKDIIPLKNELGEITTTELFLSDQPSGYFAVDMLQHMIVHKECAQLAAFMRCRKLSDIHYDDIAYRENLTTDDIEDLKDDYFVHSEEILRGFYRDGYLSDELLTENGLAYIGMGRQSGSDPHYAFPEKPVRNRARLIQHVKTALMNPVTIFTAKVERSILKGRRSNGVTFELSGNDARNNTLQIYTPEGAKKLAFCQMCLRPKPYMLMEVNNLELKPKYYFHQTRVALCLECSKRFEALREKDSIREEYLKAIRNANISNEGKVEIPVGHEDTLTFTATHLVEVQEILKRI